MKPMYTIIEYCLLLIHSVNKLIIITHIVYTSDVHVADDLSLIRYYCCHNMCAHSILLNNISIDNNLLSQYHVQ